MTLPARATRAIVLVASVLLAGAGRSQTPSPVPPLPTNSPAALAMFAPIGGFPRPGDPGQPPAGCPLLRQSGVFGFTDSMGTPDPNDDREYFLACRSDGIHIIDATPQSGTPAGVQWSASASQVVIPASNQVSFVEESGWGYLGPRPAGASVTIPENVEPGLYVWLNGHNGSSFDPNLAYCPTSNPFPYPYTTKNTTNREAVAWYEPPPANNGQGRWYVYSINTLHAGIWVIPLRRNTATAYHYLEPDPALPDYWWTGAGLLHTSIAPLGKCHMIYLTRSGGRCGSRMTPTRERGGSRSAPVALPSPQRC